MPPPPPADAHQTVPLGHQILSPLSPPPTPQGLLQHHRHVEDVDEAVIEERLKQQQRESEEDARWLHAEERNLKREQNKPQSEPGQMGEVAKENAPPTPPCAQPVLRGGLPSKLTQRISTSSRSSSTSDSMDGLTGTNSKLSRVNDGVYDSTTNVVRAVMTMTKEAPTVQADGYLDMVKKVGSELRSLLASVDEVLPQLPLDSHRQVEMAQKVLSTDMGSLINAMRLAQQNCHSPLFTDYRKSMLKSAHALAMDSKNLLDAVDSARGNNS
ncbi:focal adhesion kinase 1 [Aplysia californica]|nr:focal adhesion kinase 1 [Aplysia californica]